MKFKIKIIQSLSRFENFEIENFVMKLFEFLNEQKTIKIIKITFSIIIWI